MFEFSMLYNLFGCMHACILHVLSVCLTRESCIHVQALSCPLKTLETQISLPRQRLVFIETIFAMAMQGFPMFEFGHAVKFSEPNFNNYGNVTVDCLSCLG